MDNISEENYQINSQLKRTCLNTKCKVYEESLVIRKDTI